MGKPPVRCSHVFAPVCNSQDVVLYTTDGGDMAYMERGTLNGSSVFTVGDFGPGSNPKTSFAAQDEFNPPGEACHTHRFAPPQVGRCSPHVGWDQA